MPAGGRRPGAGAPIGNTNPHKAVALATAPQVRPPLCALQGRPHRPCPRSPEVRDYFALFRRQQLRTKRMAAGEMHKALLEVLQRAPTRSNPLLAYLRKTPPCANRPSKRPGRKSIKGGSSNSLGKGAPARKQLLFYPPGQLQKTTKKHKAILQREINQMALLLAEAAKLSNDVLLLTAPQREDAA